MVSLRNLERRRSRALLCLLAAVGLCDVAAAARFELEDGLRWTGEDGGWRVEIDARVHLDAAEYSPGTTQLDSGTRVRRMRPSLKLRFGEQWRGRLDYELGDFGSGWKNAWVDYRGLERWRIRIGNQLAPFGLEQQMSSNALPLLERSLIQALMPGFESGISANYRGNRWQVKAGVFDGDVASNDARRADGTAYTARVSFAPLHGDSFSLHLGASAENRDSLDNGELRFRTRPESYVDGQRLVDTGVLRGAERLSTRGVETAIVFRRCRFLAEQVRSRVDFGLNPMAEFDGGYAMMGCLIAGERYRYQPSSGGFRSTRSSGRLGVMELTLRRSRVSLEDAGVSGGVERNWTLGASWQFTDKVRVLADYVRMELDPNEDGLQESADVIQARFQIAF